VSGVDYPDCLILINVANQKCILFVPDVTIFYAVWFGTPETKEQLQQKFDIDEV
jgi:hypothetical protein